ncbi:MAG: GDP-mannose 4,6-dehydratase [Deltaproteobacteria bacterium]|nr:GDP-mannose 4,6-dehydratase [Deltaproteobacteria bacterium]
MHNSYYAGLPVLVTGGLGFLGSNLILELVRLGAKVTALDAMLPLYGGNFFNLEPVKDQVEVVLGDIRDEEKVKACLKGKKLVFHIAGQTSHVDSMTDPLLDIDINCRGNMIFLLACLDECPDARIVYAGTRGQYGKLKYTPVDEEHAMDPSDIYGINKMAGEKYFLLLGQKRGMAVTSLRINNTYGPRHQMKHGKYGILNWFVRLAMDGQALPVFGEGSQLRDYNYVDDVTAAFLLAGEREEAVGEVFNLGCGEPVTFRRMVEMIVAQAESGTIKTVPWPEERKQIEVGDYVADFSKIERILGWRPQASLSQGLDKTIAFYRQYKEHYWVG